MARRARIEQIAIFIGKAHCSENGAETLRIVILTFPIPIVMKGQPLRSGGEGTIQDGSYILRLY
jgi:hypothetical protein